MKKIAALAIALAVALTSATAQKKIKAFNNGGVIYQTDVRNVDSITFPGSTILFNNSLWQHNFADVDSLVFTNPNTSTADTTAIDTSTVINIVFSGSSVSITNPYSSQGVSITTSGATVTVNSTISTDNIIYNVWGTTSSGSVNITTAKAVVLRLRGASITNPGGPAIKISSDRRATIHLQAGTTNMLKDGTASSGKGVIQSAGELVFQGTGTLNIYGLAKHGIQSSGVTRVIDGNINVLSAAKDGFNVDNFIIDGGSVAVSGTAGDGIDGDQGYIQINGGTITVTCDSADAKGLNCDNDLTINAGTVNVTVNGDQSKGIKTKQRMSMLGGNVTINANGSYVLEALGSGYDPSYCTGIKAIDYAGVAGSVTINCPAANVGAKGISADGIITINGGTYNITVNGTGAAYTNSNGVRDTFSSACIKSNSNVSISGTVTVTNTGVNGKGITSDSSVTINAGAVLTATVSGTRSKAVKTDGDLMVNGGTIDITASGATGINGSDTSYCAGFKTDGVSTFNGGDITINCTSTNNGGRCISADGRLYINGGTFDLTTSGNGAGSSTRGFSPACIKADSNVFITGGDIVCTSTGRGGRGIKVDGKLEIGTLGANDSLISITANTSGSNVVSSGSGMPGGGGSSSGYKGAPKGIKALGNLTINSGMVRVYCSQTSSATAEGIESKDTIRINGGAVEVNAYDDGINASNWLCISGGKVWVNSRNNDAMDCNGTNVTLSGGLVIANGSEQAVDVDLGERQGNSLTIGGATVLARGAGMGVFSQNNTAPTMLNGQKYLMTSYTYGNTLVIKNSSSQTVCVFKHPTVSGSGFNAGTAKNGAKPPGGGGGGGQNSTNFVFSSPSVTTGSYSAFTTATITGGSSWHGYYTGATVSTTGNGTSLQAQ